MIIDNPNLFIAKIALIQDHKKYGLTLNIQLSYTKDTYNTYSSLNYMSIFFSIICINQLIMHKFKEPSW